MNFKDFSFWRYLRSVPSLWCFRKHKDFLWILHSFFMTGFGGEKLKCPEVRSEEFLNGSLVAGSLRRYEDVRGVQRSAYRNPTRTSGHRKCFFWDDATTSEVSRGPCRISVNGPLDTESSEMTSRVWGVQRSVRKRSRADLWTPNVSRWHEVIRVGVRETQEFRSVLKDLICAWNIRCPNFRCPEVRAEEVT